MTISNLLFPYDAAAIPGVAPGNNVTLPVVRPTEVTDWGISLWRESIFWVRDNAERIAVALLLGAIIVALLYALRWVGGRMAQLDKKKHPWVHIFGRALMSMRVWFMAAMSAEIIVTFADAPHTIENTVHAFFIIAGAIQGAIFARDLVLGAIAYRANDHEALNNASGIVSLLVTATVFAIAFVLMLSNLGVNVTGLLAGLGIGGIAIGLAAQGIFSDLFSALSILFDNPFRRGESIKWNDTQATVERIGLKTTRLRAVSGEELIVSNTNLLGKELHNMARLERRRVSQLFGVVYQTPVELCEDIPRLLRSLVEAESECVVVRCGFAAFNASSLDFQLDYDVNNHDYEVFFAKRAKINLAILRAFNERGIDFAYPTQTSFTAGPDGKSIMPYPETYHFEETRPRALGREESKAGASKTGDAALPDGAATETGDKNAKPALVDQKRDEDRPEKSGKRPAKPV